MYLWYSSIVVKIFHGILESRKYATFEVGHPLRFVLCCADGFDAAILKTEPERVLLKGLTEFTVVWWELTSGQIICRWFSQSRVSQLWDHKEQANYLNKLGKF